MKRQITTASFSVISAIALVACGGGGGGSTLTTPTPTPTPTPAPTPSQYIWTQGAFTPASQYKDRCVSPRTGVDLEGNPYTDVQGEIRDETFWLRSWTEETYLWNDEVTDRNPSAYSSPLDYFPLLKTFATTASGEDKDDFHFSQSTEEFLRDRNSEARSGYGASIAAISTTPPRDFRIRYTEPNSPASELANGEPALQRGTRILEIDGVDLVNANTQADIDILNDGLFPSTAGESHTFVVQDVGDATSRTLTLTSADVTRAPVNRTAVIDTDNGKVGYILFNTFSPFASEEAIATAMTEMSNEGVSDLVLDLRYNGGGLLAVASQLSYMIAGDTRTAGRTFEQLRFNSNAGNTNPVTGERNDPIPFYSTGLGFTLASGAPLDTLNLNRVFILSTGGTCSASEAVINGLRGVDVEVILIGDITCGKPYGFYPTDNCGETYYTIQFEGVNDKGEGGYSDGFVPDNSSFAFGDRLPGCVVNDDLSRELGDEQEDLLEAALVYRDTQSCPSISPFTTKGVSSKDRASASSDELKLSATDLTHGEIILQNSRDMRMPYE